MDYEKKYKEALDRARKLYLYDNGETTAEVAIACATIFPELEDVDDAYLKGVYDTNQEFENQEEMDNNNN